MIHSVTDQSSCEIDPFFGNWLAGFIAGEGCFRIHCQKHGEWYAPAFHLKLRDDDRAILDECAARVGGVVYAMPAYRTSRPGAVWRCQSRADCERLAAVLDLHPLRNRKAAEYAIWREALRVYGEMPRGNRWHGPRDWTPLIDAKRRIEDLRAYDHAVMLAAP